MRDRRGGDLITEVETGNAHEPKFSRQLLEAGEARSLPRRPGESWILDCGLQNCERMSVCCSQHPSVVLCHSSCRTLTRCLGCPFQRAGRRVQHWGPRGCGLSPVSSLCAGVARTPLRGATPLPPRGRGCPDASRRCSMASTWEPALFLIIIIIFLSEYKKVSTKQGRRDRRA